MSKIRDTLINRYLPIWAKETVLAENRTLHRKVLDLQVENDLLNAYIDGIKLGMKARKDNEIQTSN